MNLIFFAEEKRDFDLATTKERIKKFVEMRKKFDQVKKAGASQKMPALYEELLKAARLIRKRNDIAEDVIKQLTEGILQMDVTESIV